MGIKYDFVLHTLKIVLIQKLCVGFLTAAVFAGMICGGFLGGVLGDIYGRKPVLLTTLAINAASAFLSAFSTSIYWLILFRTMAGLGT